jgi:starch synthase
MSNSEEGSSTASSEPAIALLPWGNVFEDFLDTIKVSFETFCDEFMGSWMFGYVEALRRAGVRTVIICMSARVSVPSRYRHVPTGATICLLPVPWSYRVIRSKLLNPYGRTIKQALGEVRGSRMLLFPLLALSKEIVLYLTTPLRSVARELGREGCSAILCQEYEYPRFDACLLLGRWMGLPVFATFQGGDYQRSRIERYLRPHTLRASSGLIIGTQTESQRVRARYGLPPGKIARIFNPIDLAIWSGVDRDEAKHALGIPLGARVVMWHGRVSMQQKGLDVLLEAWERFCRSCRGRDLRLLLVGTGKDTERVQQQIASMQLEGVSWVNEFVHDRSAICRYLSAGDVYVFPSRHEGFPVSPIEAMACGLPVIAADAQGVSDIFEDGEASGGIVVPRDDPEALALALGRLIDDPVLSSELGNRARRRAETCFSLDTIGKQLREFLLQGRFETGAIAEPRTRAYQEEPVMRSVR